MKFKSQKLQNKIPIITQYTTYFLMIMAGFNLYRVFEKNIVGIERLYTTLIFILFIVGIIFGHIRKNNKFYFASFSEMPDTLYWFSLQQLYTIIVVIHAYFKIEMSGLFQDIYRVAILLTLLMYIVTLQTKPWVSRTAYEHDKRINRLFKKSKLSINEINAVTPQLIKITKDTQSLPLSWRVIKWVMIFILAISLNIVSDFIIKYSGNVFTFDEIIKLFAR